MKVNNFVNFTGCLIRDKKSGEMVPYLPDFIVAGKQRVTHVDTSTMWGTLIKTDKNQRWLNASWFSLA